jgi:hypothetical protein
MSESRSEIKRIRQKAMCDIVTGDDGYEYYWPQADHGAYSSFDLRTIADYLDELNKGWDEQVRAEMEKDWDRQIQAETERRDA